jgi:hypothetical protein
MEPWNNQYRYSSWDRQTTNIQYVTSLEEALSRSNIRSSENVYFHQDQPIFYRIKVEPDGRKYWQEFPYGSPKQVDNTPVVKQDLIDLEGRIKCLENLLIKEVSDEQSNGQIPVSTTELRTNADSSISAT